MSSKTLGAIIVTAVAGGVICGFALEPSASAPSYTIAAAPAAPSSVEKAEADLDAARARLESAQEAESAAQRRAEQASQAASEAAARSREAAARAERARRERGAADKASQETRAELGRLAAYAYANNAELGQLAELGAAIDPQDFQSRSSSLSELMRVQDTIAREAATSRADAVDAAVRAEGQAKAAAEAAAKAAELSKEARQALAEAAAATREAQQALQEIRQVHSAAQQAQAERDAAESMPDRGEGAAAASAPPPSGDGIFTRPSTGPITSPYGMRVHPLTGVYKLHSGTDFGAPCGSGVHAAYPGTVTSVGYEGAYGNQIVVSHGQIDGLAVETTYNHLSGFDAGPGQAVAAGELIGRVGATGSSTGCHLHFEVLVNGQFTDPMGWL